MIGGARRERFKIARRLSVAAWILVPGFGCESPNNDPGSEHAPYWLGDPEPGMCDGVEVQWQATLADHVAWAGTGGIEDMNVDSVVLSPDGEGCMIDEDYCTVCNGREWLDVGMPAGLGPGVYSLSGWYEGPVVQEMECYLPGDASFCLMGGGYGVTGKLVIEASDEGVRGCLLELEGPSWLEVSSVGFEVEACD